MDYHRPQPFPTGSTASDVDPGNYEMTNDTKRILRGGGFVQPGTQCRCTSRWTFPMKFKAGNWGFRVARTLQ
jgi:formylglycine-generating enzyme required for sulfatase activity